jgi:hypothetical protein
MADSWIPDHNHYFLEVDYHRHQQVAHHWRLSTQIRDRPNIRRSPVKRGLVDLRGSPCTLFGHGYQTFDGTTRLVLQSLRENL